MFERLQEPTAEFLLQFQYWTPIIATDSNSLEIRDSNYLFRSPFFVLITVEFFQVNETFVDNRILYYTRYRTSYSYVYSSIIFHHIFTNRQRGHEKPKILSYIFIRFNRILLLLQLQIFQEIGNPFFSENKTPLYFLILLIIIIYSPVWKYDQGAEEYLPLLLFMKRKRQKIV